MKPTFRFIIAAMAAVSMFASCQKAVETAVPEAGDIHAGGLRVTGRMAEMETKTSFTKEVDQLTPHWKVGDKIIGLWGTDKTVMWRVKSVSAEGVEFKLESGTEPWENGTEVSVIYAPGRGIADIQGTGDGRTLAFDLSDQDGTLESLGNYSLMTGKGTVNDSSLPLTFSHSIAVVSLDRIKNLTAGNIYTVSLSGTDLANSGQFAFSDGELSFTKGADGAITTSNNFTADASGQIGSIFFAVPAANIAKFSVTASWDTTPEAKVTGSFYGAEIEVGHYYYKSEFVSGSDPDYVTIGGKKWMTKNLGATTVAGSIATCAGDYYQWGSVSTLYNSIVWNGNTPTFSWKEGKEGGFINDNLDYEADSNLPDDNDVVKRDLGNGWRMPTPQDFRDLFSACGLYGDGSGNEINQIWSSNPPKGCYWLTCNQSYLPEYNGVAGVLFCDGTNKLFFPAAGGAGNTGILWGYISVNSQGAYWMSSFNSSKHNPDDMFFSDTQIFRKDASWGRSCGFSIRPVSDL